MTNEQKHLRFKEICKDILLKHVAEGKSLPSKIKLNELAEMQFNDEFRTESIRMFLNDAQRNNKLAAVLIANHPDEAFRLAQALCEKDCFYFSDSEEALSEFKTQLKQYQEEEHD